MVQGHYLRWLRDKDPQALARWGEQHSEIVPGYDAPQARRPQVPPNSTRRAISPSAPWTGWNSMRAAHPIARFSCSARFPIRIILSLRRASTGTCTRPSRSRCRLRSISRRSGRYRSLPTGCTRRSPTAPRGATRLGRIHGARARGQADHRTHLRHDRADRRLFDDLKTDPGELKNLWREPDASRTRHELTERLARKLMELSDTSPLATHHGP